jgi:hypothetical protein
MQSGYRKTLLANSADASVQAWGSAKARAKAARSIWFRSGQRNRDAADLIWSRAIAFFFIGESPVKNTSIEGETAASPNMKAMWSGMIEQWQLGQPKVPAMIDPDQQNRQG